jgi:hypothetical protein
MIAVITAGCGTAPLPPSPPAMAPGVASPGPAAVTPVPGARTPTATAPSPSDTSSMPAATGPDLVGRLGCGQGSGIDVPASILDQPAAAERGPSMPARALVRFVTTPDAAEMGYPPTGWRVAAASPDRVDFLAPGRDGWYFVSVADIAEQGGWQAWEYGACDLQVRLPEGIGFATWDVDPAHPPQPDATSLTVLASEVACASGKPIDGRLAVPIVLYAPGAITIVLEVRSRPGGQDCQGTSPEPVTVELTEPLGDRALFDGSSHPAKRRG